MSDIETNNEIDLEDIEHRSPIQKIINDSSKSEILATPDDFTEPDAIYDMLIKKIKEYHPSDDFSLIEKAYHMADDAHKDQKRKRALYHSSSLRSEYLSRAGNG